MDLTVVFELLMAISGLFALAKIRGNGRWRPNIHHKSKQGNSKMAHEHPGSLLKEALLQEIAPPPSTTVDNAVCERAPTGRGPLNYLPRQASMSMQVSQRRTATTQASSNK